jgi:hypothetical protein
LCICKYFKNLKKNPKSEIWVISTSDKGYSAYKILLFLSHLVQNGLYVAMVAGIIINPEKMKVELTERRNCI